MTFSDKIKRAREVAGFTQQQLADQVGVSKRTIAAYESTDAKARPSTMRKLAEALGVSTQTIWPERKSPIPNTASKSNRMSKRSEQHVVIEQPER